MESDESDFNETEGGEIGSDELLADDGLRLPDSANILVRLHAVRAWLARRRNEAAIEVGEAALALQQEMEAPTDEFRPRRRVRQQLEVGASPQTRLSHSQQALTAAQEQLSAFEEAQELLEECVAHTSGERALVEYYLTLEHLLLDNGYSSDAINRVPTQRSPQVGAINLAPTQRSPWYDAMAEVLHRIEHVGTTQEE